MNFLRRKVLHILALILGTMVVIYLIYLIPNESLKNTSLAIISSILGGLFTLVGVAWTIKKGEANRQADLQRIENERKEEERQKHVPYIRLANEYQATYAARIEKIKEIDFFNPSETGKIQNDLYYVIKIEPFTIKNISSSTIVVNGVYLDNKYYPFSCYELVECNGTCQIQFSINHWFAFLKKLESIKLVVSDILNNRYTITCKLYLRMDNAPQKDVAPNNKEYTVHSYTCTIESLSLPELQGGLRNE